MAKNNDLLGLIERLAREHRFEFKVTGSGGATHVQVRGVILVNWYPLSQRQMMYVSGTVAGVISATAKQVISAARGIDIRTGQQKFAERKRSYAADTDRLFKLHCGRCFWCKTITPRKLGTTDHVIALSKGGANNMNNYVYACHGCNQRRGNALPTEDMPCPNSMKRLRKPTNAALPAVRQRDATLESSSSTPTLAERCPSMPTP